MVNSSIEHFAAQQQCERNKLLHSHGNNEHVYTAHSYVYITAKNAMSRGTSVVTVVTQMCHNVMLHVHCLSCSISLVTIKPQREDRHFFAKFSVTISFTFCTPSLNSQCTKNNTISSPFATFFGLHTSLTLLAALWPRG